MATQIATPIKASTQEHLDVEDIQDDLVLLKDGACALVIQVTAINFGLLSESEQDAIIFAYAGLLNSLSFPIQIIVRSTIKDITDYIRLLRKQEQKQKNSLLLDQLHKYRIFIEETVRDNQVIDKKFYAIIPFTALELGLTSSVGSSFKKKKGLPYSKTYIMEKAKMSLYPKRDHLLRQFGRLGLQAKQLATQELLELLYNLYNQESVGQIFSKPLDYTTSITKAAMENEGLASIATIHPGQAASSKPGVIFPKSTLNKPGYQIQVPLPTQPRPLVAPSPTSHNQASPIGPQPQQSPLPKPQPSAPLQTPRTRPSFYSPSPKPQPIAGPQISKQTTIFVGNNPEGKGEPTLADKVFGYDKGGV